MRGNPGVVGVGGALFNPDGKIVLQYDLGLGLVTRNQAKYPTLWKGFEIDIAKKMSNLMVFGDSMLVI